MYIDIITTFKLAYQKIRNDEILFALNKNSELNWVDNIYVYSEDQATVDWLNSLNINKLKAARTAGMFTYSDAIRIANTAVDMPHLFKNIYHGKIFAIINSDIFLDDSIYKIDFTDEKLVYCLTRSEYSHEAKRSYHMNANYCFDAYIFKTPVIVNIANLNFRFGIPGCDSRFAYELSRNMHVINYSRTVIANHVHCSGYRTYNEGMRLHGPYISIDLASNTEYNPNNVHVYNQ